MNTKTFLGSKKMQVPVINGAPGTISKNLEKTRGNWKFDEEITVQIKEMLK